MATSHFAVFVLALAAAGLQSAQATNYPDLYAFKYEGASGSSEVHVLSGADEYKAFNLQTGTGLHKSSSDTFTLLRNSKDDLFAVKYKGDSDSTEVHILSKASKYKKFSLQTATGLHTTSADTFQFLLDSNDNLVAIKYEGKSKHTEVHVLSAASDYKEFILQTATGLHTTTFDTFQFALGSNDDLYCFKYEGESLKTEVHVLSKASGYKKFSLQTPTALEETSFDTFRFLIGPNDDLYAIKYDGESKSTEVHVLSKDSHYKKFILQTGTKLHTTSSDTFAFALKYSAPDLSQKPSN